MRQRILKVSCGSTVASLHSVTRQNRVTRNILRNRISTLFFEKRPENILGNIAWVILVVYSVFVWSTRTADRSQFSRELRLTLTESHCLSLFYSTTRSLSSIFACKCRRHDNKVSFLCRCPAAWWWQARGRHVRGVFYSLYSGASAQGQMNWLVIERRGTRCADGDRGIK